MIDEIGALRTSLTSPTAYIYPHNPPAAIKQGALIRKARYGDYIQICTGVDDHLAEQIAINAANAFGIANNVPTNVKYFPGEYIRGAGRVLKRKLTNIDAEGAFFWPRDGLGVNVKSIFEFEHGDHARAPKCRGGEIYGNTLGNPGYAFNDFAHGINTAEYDPGGAGEIGQAYNYDIEDWYSHDTWRSNFAISNWRDTITTPAAAAQPDVIVDDVGRFKIGDFVLIGDSLINFEYNYVAGINPATNTLTMLNNLANNYAVGGFLYDLWLANITATVKNIRCRNSPLDHSVYLSPCAGFVMENIDIQGAYPAGEIIVLAFMMNGEIKNIKMHNYSDPGPGNGLIFRPNNILLPTRRVTIDGLEIDSGALAPPPFGTIFIDDNNQYIDIKNLRYRGNGADGLFVINGVSHLNIEGSLQVETPELAAERLIRIGNNATDGKLKLDVVRSTNPIGASLVSLEGTNISDIDLRGSRYKGNAAGFLINNATLPGLATNINIDEVDNDGGRTTGGNDQFIHWGGHSFPGKEAANGYYETNPQILSTTACIMVVNRLCAVPKRVPITRKYDQVAFYLTLAVPATNVRLGLYRDNGSESPTGGLLVQDFGQVSSAGAATETIIAIAPVLRLLPGLYWLVAISDGVPQLSGCSVASAFSFPMGYGIAVQSHGRGYYVASAFGALPATFPAAPTRTVNPADVPYIDLRVFRTP